MMVRKLVERADVLVERSHSFAPLIKDTCNRLDSGFNDFFQKIMRINHKEVGVAFERSLPWTGVFRRRSTKKRAERATRVWRKNSSSKN